MQTNGMDWSVTDAKVEEAVRRIVAAADPLKVILFASRARGDFRVRQRCRSRSDSGGRGGGCGEAGSAQPAVGDRDGGRSHRCVGR